MYKFLGNGVLSVSLEKKLQEKLQKLIPTIIKVSTRFIHFVDNEELTSKQQERLEVLFDYGIKNTVFDTNKDINDEEFIITPRVMTISPWSSKATDIIHNCSLGNIGRAERGIIYTIKASLPLNEREKQIILTFIYDKMTQDVFYSIDEIDIFSSNDKEGELKSIDIFNKGIEELYSANKLLGLALDDGEIKYIYESFKKNNRNPTDVELMMFGQINSEHCRHKIFNADWFINGIKQKNSLFNMIKNTHKNYSDGVLSAYHDNAAVILGSNVDCFNADVENNYSYGFKEQENNIQIKVETHNHPTAISPFAGAATGIGGEIRDEAATGTGAKTKAGVSGYTVSNLEIADFMQPWETPYGNPLNQESALNIMLDAPIGAAAYNNEFGRPNLCGYFRTFEMAINDTVWGYHKPIMISGGYGNIYSGQIKKHDIPAGSKIIVLGGPGMLIGLGGGSVSSLNSGSSSEDIDFSSVQRANPEMQRRAQEVINSCWGLGDKNPILSIHDVGAGGLSNAIPELVADSGRGAIINLQSIDVAEKNLSPLEIWCNESQERYVLAINNEDIPLFTAMAKREKCPFAVVGEATVEKSIILKDASSDIDPINIPTDVLFNNAPKLIKKITEFHPKTTNFDTSEIIIDDAVKRVLKLPAVSCKKFLITIGDRTVGGMTSRDQMVGPWQIPVSDVAVTASSYTTYRGESVAMGEKPTLALINPSAAARMTVGESITNISSALIENISDIKLSANWMAASGHEDQDSCLYDMVKTVGMEFCQDLNIAIPVGKDSLSMKTSWSEDDAKKQVVSPVSLVVTAFSPVTNIKKTITPQLKLKIISSELILIDLGEGKNRMGGSCIAQTYNHIGKVSPDIDSQKLSNFFKAIQLLNNQGKILAYHDRSDGGLFVTLCEMMFAAKCGLNIDIHGLGDNHIESLFNEELGAVIQIRSSDYEMIMNSLRSFGLKAFSIGNIVKDNDAELIIKDDIDDVFSAPRGYLQALWSELSYKMQSMRDDVKCAEQEFGLIKGRDDNGLFASIPFDFQKNIAYEYLNVKNKPKVAILREQGVNGYMEMAAAFALNGFDAVDVHMSDLKSGKVELTSFRGLIACGGFSYGDVLGSGSGWANSILFDLKLRDQFSYFFARQDTFTLGVCNGCQMLSKLKDLIPGAESWPEFERNSSNQFESRFSMVEIMDTNSIFFKDMQGTKLAVPVAHGDGRVSFRSDEDKENITAKNQAPMRFIDSNSEATEYYPLNPNGSENGLTSFTSLDGRATIMMPHPERAFRLTQMSWCPIEWHNLETDYSPWMRMFANARKWVD